MKLEANIHCGEVVSVVRINDITYTETVHAPGTRLEMHAHRAGHLAILKHGAYFEKIEGQCYLRLPGDSVFYPGLLEHENRFGRIRSTCLNLETSDGSLTDIDANPVVVEMAMRAIREQPKLSLSGLAASLGYSSGYLARVFRVSTGMTVGDYVRRARIRKAAVDIFHSDLSLAEIALEAGYYDQSHCTNELVALAGFTPNELRRFAEK